MGSAERVSRYEFAVEVVNALGLDEGLVKPVSAAELGLLAKRPRDTSFDVSKVSKLLKISSLEENIKEIAPLLRAHMNFDDLAAPFRLSVPTLTAAPSPLFPLPRVPACPSSAP